jgi:DNA mismatch repair protein MutS2
MVALLQFLNKEFDRVDHYFARAMFLRGRDFALMLPNKGKTIKLAAFAHPAIANVVPIDIEFKNQIMLITGVNAGGKTMLLKSILSAVFLAKYLLPMKINASKSQIAQLKEITAIIDDPQSVKNDISTFAGRMVEFSKLFKKDNFIAGVDEIELGTDSDEAASLFKVILEKLMQKNTKIIITTHHKRLAAMLATNENVSLSAAIYDEQNQRPTFEFLHGTIGKSYAFETANRYGIPPNIISEAKEVYGEDKENLNDLIQTNIDLELKMREKLKILDAKIDKTDKLKDQLQNQKDIADQEIQKSKNEFEKKYIEAIEAAKKAAKETNPAQIHKLLNKAHQKKQQLQPKEQNRQYEKLKVGDFIKYNNAKGVIKSIKKTEALIECNGMKLRVPLKNLKRSGNQPPQKKIHTKIHIQKPTFSSIKLDLHGLRAEEAIEKLDKFLSDALITGYDEVLVYHGIGSGKLAYAVKEFLKSYPRVEKFSDAPANMGGFGATVIKL